MTKFLVFLLSLICLFTLTHSAILKTLSQEREAQKDLLTLYSKAVEFLHKTHPQLSNYLIVEVTTDLQRGNQLHANNLRDYHFQLDDGSKKVTAIVTLSVDNGQEFVSISPFVIKMPQAETGNNMGEYFISETIQTSSGSNIINLPITSQPTPTISNNKLPPSYPDNNLPGGYYPYSDLNDPLIEYSKDFLAAQHPNMVNYLLEGAAYQVVAGINVRLNYKGVDGYSRVTATMNFDIKNQPRLLRIQTDCVTEDQNCSKETSWEYFNAVEAMIISHPELLNFRISAVTVDQLEAKFKALLTFDNRKGNLRTLVQLIIEKNKFTVQSFFTYTQQY